MFPQRLSRDEHRSVAVAGLQKQSSELDARLDAARETLDCAPQDVLCVRAKARERELGRDVNHGFETVRAVFQ